MSSIWLNFEGVSVAPSEQTRTSRAVRGAAKPLAEKQRPSKIAARKAPRKAPRQVVEAPVVDTIIDVIEEPAPGVVVVTE
jgi:hypothetical protein